MGRTVKTECQEVLVSRATQAPRDPQGLLATLDHRDQLVLQDWWDRRDSKERRCVKLESVF